ncbi:MAG TPA: hypothetical protein DCQ33_12770 [Nitrospira sp.]|nr:hypothetical protein [Nitrospira sp.]
MDDGRTIVVVTSVPHPVTRIAANVMIGVGADQTEAVEQLFETCVSGTAESDIAAAIAWARRNGRI